MEVVSNQELAEFFERLTGTIEGLGAKLAPPGNGCAQEYFSREEAAEYLRMGTTKLDAHTKTGEIRRAKLGHGPKATVLYRKQDLDAFVESCLEMDKAEARKHIRR